MFTGEAETLADVSTASAPAFFCVGTAKLIAMDVATFGLYPVWWFYKNWQTEQELSKEMLSPAARAIFSVVFFQAFASRTKERALLLGVPARFSPLPLSIPFIALNVLAARLPLPWTFVALLSTLLI